MNVNDQINQDATHVYPMHLIHTDGRLATSFTVELDGVSAVPKLIVLGKLCRFHRNVAALSMEIPKGCNMKKVNAPNPSRPMSMRSPATWTDAVMKNAVHSQRNFRAVLKVESREDGRVGRRKMEAVVKSANALIGWKADQTSVC